MLNGAEDSEGKPGLAKSFTKKQGGGIQGQEQNNIWNLPRHTHVLTTNLMEEGIKLLLN